jgi:hypothetical protein
MKRFVLFVFTFLPAFCISLSAQNLTGIWRGYFITDEGDQYRFETQIEQKNNTLSGVTYSYKDKSFYGKCTMTGNFSRGSGNALIQEIKTIEVKMSLASSACIQKCLLTYAKSGKEEFLEGTFSSIIEKTDTLRDIKRGDDCGGGKMVLRKVATSDFYVEPFLRKKTPVTNNPPIVKNNPPANTNTNTKKPNVKPPVNNTQKKNEQQNKTATVKPKVDSIQKADVDRPRTDTKKEITAKSKLPEALKTRENSLVQTLTINSETVVVKLYDNGQIDNDTISVYLDNQLVLSKKKLTTSALTINLKMDESNAEHELVMVAENLGEIPPNTSLMIVTAGEQRFEVRITSTEQKNAVVRFKYVKKVTPVPLP